MLSKKLIGSFMLVGPFLAIISIFIEPGSLGDEGTFAESLQAMADNYALSMISNLAWAAAILAIFIGIFYLARSM